MRPAAASAALLIAFAVVLVSQASDEESPGDESEQHIKFCDNNTTNEEKNNTLQCVLGSPGRDVERLRSYMNHTGTNHSEVARLLCQNPDKLHHNVTKYHNPNATEPEDLDLGPQFKKCEKNN